MACIIFYPTQYFFKKKAITIPATFRNTGSYRSTTIALCAKSAAERFVVVQTLLWLLSLLLIVLFLASPQEPLLTDADCVKLFRQLGQHLVLKILSEQHEVVFDFNHLHSH